jgi:hypothetical protein
VIAVGTAVLNSGGWLPAPLAYRWNGTAWQALTVPASVGYMELAHVKAFSPTDAWAIGASTTVPGAASATHWNGSAWTSFTTPVLSTLNLTMNAISGSSGHDVWAAGQARSSGYHNTVRQSVLVHYDGTSWTQVTVPDTKGLLDVAALSPTDVWTLGVDGSVLHWDGTAWTVKTQVNGANALAVASSTNVWVAGVVSVVHYDGTSWTSSALPTGISVVTGGAALASGSFWFAGSYYPSNAEYAPALLSR